MELVLDTHPSSFQRGEPLKPIVSVIIPFYREGKILAPAIESVLAQTFQEWELLLVDNNASEETRNIAESYSKNYPERIQLLHEPEQGAISARNTGIRQARGDFIAFLDGDDLMKPERLQRQIDILSSSQDLVLVACYYDLLSNDGSTILEKDCRGFAYGSKNILEWKSYLHALFLPFHLPHYQSFDLFGTPFLFFRKKDAMQAGLLNSRFNPRDLEDFEFCMRMFERGGFYLIPESLQFYRAETTELRQRKHKDKHTKIALMKLQTFLSVIWERYGKDYPENQVVFRSIYSFHLNNFGCYLMQFKQGKNIGTSLIRQAAITNPKNFLYWKNYIKTFFPRKKHPRLFDFEIERNDPIEFTMLDWKNPFAENQPRKT